MPGTSWLLTSGPVSMKRSIKKGILSSIRRYGWEVRRSRNSNAEPPPTFDDPWEVIWHLRSGKPATLNCPIAECVRPFGHAFGSWEHLTEASREIIRDQSATYEDSILRTYFDTFRPVDASSAVLGLTLTSLKNRSPLALLCPPWTVTSVDKIIRGAERGLTKENAEHGASGLTIHDGTAYFGPVSPRKGELEHLRLKRLVASIGSQGYDRSYGDLDVTVLRRGSQFRYLKLGVGYHRTAVMCALGEVTIPAVPRYPYVIEVEQAQFWPQVQRGVWSYDDAVAYFHHLFDFESSTWATAHHLVEQTSARLTVAS